MVVDKSDGADLKFKNPGRLLIIVIAFIFWGVGLIDLIGHESAQPTILDSYSLAFFLFILLYACTITIWIVLFFNANILTRVTAGIQKIQSHSRLVSAIFVGLGIAFWVLFEWDRWSRLPGLQFAIFGLLLLTTAVLLLANWNESAAQQQWRKIIAYPLLVLLVIELTIQAVAFFGVLPGTYTIGGDFAPYERIYYNEAGFRNGYANRYGWTFPDFRLAADGNRILIVGGGHVQALQVTPEEQISARLSAQTNENQPDGSQSEFVSIGLPGFGLSSFLFDAVLSELPNIINSEEIIIMFHLGDDFQSPAPSSDPIVYTLDENSRAEVHPSDARLRHDLTHYYLHGFTSFQLVETMRSNYLTPKVITNLLRNSDSETPSSEMDAAGSAFTLSRMRGKVVANFALTEPGHAGIRTTDTTRIPGGNNFMFQKDGNAGQQEALAITRSVLERAQEVAEANGTTLRIVTIPAFPETFFTQYQTGNWESEVGEYDLFLPEAALVDIARDNHIAILPMGQFMFENGVSADEIRQFYFAGGHGFTPQGHDYFANAIYACFYAEMAHPACASNAESK